MPVPRFLFRLFTFLLLSAAPAVTAQWVVYDARISPVLEVSENFSPYTGIYFIAPVGGGNASMVFLTEEGGRFYNISENGARYFTAAGPVGRLAVLSAVAHSATARAMYQCVGLLNSTLSYTVKGERLGGRVSTDMIGTMLASDDESQAPGPGVDGSIGMVGSAQIKATLRIDLSRILNQKDRTMSQAVAEIVGLLEKYGYQADTGIVEEAQPAAAAPGSGAGAAEPEPAPAPESPTTEDEPTSIFPPGAREEMERKLNQPLNQ